MLTELDVIITNPTDGNYDDINVVVRPDFPVSAVGQLSNLSGFSFEDVYGVLQRSTAQDMSTGVATPMEFLGTDAGYRVHCDRIPQRSSLRIVMALVAIKESEPANSANMRALIKKGLSPSDLAMQMTFNDSVLGKHSYWYGSKENQSLYGPQPRPTHLSINGSYVASNRILHVDRNVSVGP